MTKSDIFNLFLCEADGRTIIFYFYLLTFVLEFRTKMASSCSPLWTSLCSSHCQAPPPCPAPFSTGTPGFNPLFSFFVTNRTTFYKLASLCTGVRFSCDCFLCEWDLIINSLLFIWNCLDSCVLIYEEILCWLNGDLWCSWTRSVQVVFCFQEGKKGKKKKPLVSVLFRPEVWLNLEIYFNQWRIFILLWATF